MRYLELFTQNIRKLLRVDKILKIVEIPEVVKVPWSEDHIIGITNVEGELLPVVGLGELYGQWDNEYRYIVVVELEEDYKVCIAVEDIGATLNKEVEDDVMNLSTLLKEDV